MADGAHRHRRNAEPVRQLIAKVDSGRGISCRGYQRRGTPRTFVFKLLTATPLTITYGIVDRITNTTAHGIQFCLAANFAFKTASGRPAATTVLPDGTRGHVGLLPRCVNPIAPAGRVRQTMRRTHHERQEQEQHAPAST